MKSAIPASVRERFLGAVVVLALCLGCALTLWLVPSVKRQNPLTDSAFLASPQAVNSAVEAAQSEGRTADATLLGRIADQPQASWLNGDSADADQVRTLTRQARQSHKTAVFVVYNLPSRDACSSYSAGGAQTEEAYDAWIARIADAVDGPAVFVVEPDAIGDTLEHCRDSKGVEARYRMLRAAVHRLKSVDGIVYIDAANPQWFKDPGVLADALLRAGIGEADGISVNVSNFVATPEAVKWAQKLLASLKEHKVDKGAVIDTSRNGNGIYGGPALDDAWCNPPGRALGHVPTSQTGQEGIDAYLWIKAPGESDGDCRPGEPAAGTFWLDYALDLARRAK